MPTATSTALRPYSGNFGPAEARHLLRRATIGGGTEANVRLAVELGLAGSVKRLFAPHDIGLPLTQIDDHPVLRRGQPWLNVARGADANASWRDGSLLSWLLAELLESGFTVRGRMWYFWINHFGVITEAVSGLSLRYLLKLYDLSLGDFRRLIAEITIDGQMLRFLNGNRSAKRAPNENYARELLELFTVGKGPQRSTGDYTNYTEDDVREIARALTGWIVLNPGYYEGEGEPRSEFRKSRHDVGEKRLSAAFGNAIIANAGETEYETVVDVVLGQPRSLDYLCRKLYRWFVDYEIADGVEEEVIRPLAEVCRATGYDVGATIRTLLQSEHFYDAASRGVLPKSPLDFAAEVYGGFGGALPPRSDVYRRYRAARQIHWKLREQGLSINYPDSVAGFPPYHQEPNFNRLWITPAGLLVRRQIANEVRGSGLHLGQDDYVTFDLLAYVDTFENPSNPNDLIAELAERHLAQPIPFDQVRTLKDFLIPDLPDYEWTIEYELYRGNPADEGQRSAVAKRVGDVWLALCSSAEFALY